MKKIIINADDYGKTLEDTRAIVESIKKGIVNQTTLMVNMPYTENAVEIAYHEGFKNLIGLHLNLTEGKPLTEKIANDPLFCDLENGCFNGVFHMNTIYKLHLPAESKEALRDEIVAQIKKFYTYELPLRHLDSHHHVHKDYSVLKILLPILEKEHWNTLRIANNTQKRRASKLYNYLINKYISFSNIQGASELLFSSAEDALNGMKKNIHSVEVEVHPFVNHGILYDHNCRLESLLSLLSI